MTGTAQGHGDHAGRAGGSRRWDDVRHGERPGDEPARGDVGRGPQAAGPGPQAAGQTPQSQRALDETGAAPDEQGAAPDEGPHVSMPRTPGAIAKQAVQILASMALAGVLLGWLLPFLTGTPWSTILGIITGIGWVTFFELLGLMFVGLYCYTFTLTGSLPGLRHSQAILANLAGSGVSNTLPGGGAVGAALTYAMFRSWRFSHRRISTSIIVTAVWNMLARVILPVIAAVLLLPETQNVPTAMIQGAIVGGAGGAVIAAALLAIIASRRAARWVGRAVDTVFGPLVRRIRRTQPRHDVEELALDLRDKIIDLVRGRWFPLTFGLAGFMGIYFVLFRQCLEAVGVHMSWSHAFAAYAVGRLLTTVAVTPGGIGVAEAGSAAVMLAMGVPGEGTAAAVTLFALFSYLLEIPLGALAAVLWLNTRAHYARKEHPEERLGEQPRPGAQTDPA